MPSIREIRTPKDMRSRSSSNHSYGSMELERSKTREEPQLSGAYIRSLVKQLSSSRTKELMNPKSPNTVLGDELSQDPTKPAEFPGEPQPPQLPVPPQPKKQVRRRLHTSRPYQERLLNMAEARREIVTALKFHRASMKQAQEQQQQQQHTRPPLPPPPPPPPPPQPSPPPLAETTPRVCHTNSMLPNYFGNPLLQPYTYPSPCSWPYSPIAPLPVSDTLNFPLPNQPLGLNLSFQGFTNIESPFYSNKPSIYSPSSPSSSASSYSSPSPSPPMTLPGLQAPTVLNGPPSSSEIAFNPASSVLHPVMDDDEIAKIRSLGQQHDMEWNDTMNLMTSAWWCKFLNNMELDSHEGAGGDGDGFQVFEEVMDIPAWLSDGSGVDASDGNFLPQHCDDYFLDNYSQDSVLPCLDIGEIEGLDGDWLS